MRMLIAIAALAAAPLAAQDAPAPSATPVPEPTATVAPPPVVLTQPPAVAPSPAATAPTPAPSATPTRRPRPQATASAAPTATATPAPVPTVPIASAPVAAPTPRATPQSAPVAAPVEPQSGGGWWLMGVLAAIAGAGAGFWLLRRRSAEPDEIADPVVPPTAPVAPSVEPVAVPVAPVAPPPASGGFVTSSLRPKIELGFRPVRAGTETLRARVEYEVAIANVGSALAAGLHVELILLSAGNDHDALLSHFWTAPPERPIAADIRIEPGGVAALAGEALVDRDALETITAAGRRMFVPLVAMRVLSGSGGLLARGAWLIGVAREGQAKLAPISLERNGMRGDVAARDYPVK